MRFLAVLPCAVAVAVAEYPGYCAKDMNVNKIQRLEDQVLSKLKLIQVQLIVRHGARTPWTDKKCWNGYDEEWNCSIHELQRPELKNETLVLSREFEKIYTKGQNAFPGTCNLGQMVDEGYHQQILNGKHLREAYVGPHGLFQSTDNLDVTNVSDVYFESSDIPRTINSGMIIMDTMFSRNGNETDKPAVPWHTCDYSRNIITPNPTMCPKLKWIDQEWRQSTDYLAWKDSPENQKLELDLKKVVTNYDHVTLFDCFMTSKCTDRKLPAGIDDDLFTRTTDREASEQIQQYLFNNSAYARAGMAAFIKNVRNRAIDGTKFAAPRFTLSAAHDTTIMPLLGALGGSSWLTEWVPYASHMIFELYKNQTDHYVRILYQGKPMTVPGCPSQLCPFSAFLELTEFSTQESICTLQANALDSPQVGSSDTTTSTWTLVYAIGGLLAGTALGYFAGSRLNTDRHGYSMLPNKS